MNDTPTEAYLLATADGFVGLAEALLRFVVEARDPGELGSCDDVRSAMMADIAVAVSNDIKYCFDDLGDVYPTATCKCECRSDVENIRDALAD